MPDRKTREDRVYFSVEEANQLVPELNAHFDLIQTRIARIREIHHHLASLGGAHPGKLRSELLALHGEHEGFAARKPITALAAPDRNPPRSSSLH